MVIFTLLIHLFLLTDENYSRTWHCIYCKCNLQERQSIKNTFFSFLNSTIKLNFMQRLTYSCHKIIITYRCSDAWNGIFAACKDMRKRELVIRIRFTCAWHITDKKNPHLFMITNFSNQSCSLVKPVKKYLLSTILHSSLIKKQNTGLNFLKPCFCNLFLSLNEKRITYLNLTIIS